MSRDFTDLAGCALPLQLASLGGVGTPALAAAVSEAGGLGMIPNPLSAAEVERCMEEARARTERPVGFGFLIPFLVKEAVEAAASTVGVVEFFYGEPDAELVRLAGGGGAIVGWQTGSATEALAAQRAGCDFVVAQGIEAGGHVRAAQALDEVLAETLAAVEVPVIAAGGVGTAHRLAELLESGASAVRVGTRFVASEEADAHPAYVERLIAASGADTVLTEVFGLGWPHAPHRVLTSSVEAASELDHPIVASLDGFDVPRLSPMPPNGRCRGAIEAMPLYAGLSVDAVTRVQPAAEIVAELTAGLARGPAAGDQ